MCEFHFFLSELLYDIDRHILSALKNDKTIIYDNYVMSILAVKSAIALSSFGDDAEMCIKYFKNTIDNLLGGLLYEKRK